MTDKYAEELEKERGVLEKSNPFKKLQSNHPNKNIVVNKSNVRSVPFSSKKDKDSSYFHMILGSDFEDIEMEIRGLRYYKDIDDDTGKEVLVMRKIEDHYLSEQGAEDLLSELKGHTNPDIKLGFMSRDEFLMQMDIIRKFLVSYINNNLYKIGMDSEQKQRKAPTLIVMILARIRSVYSRSIAGKENERSHGQMNLSGELDMGGKYDRNYKMEDLKN